MVDIEREGGTSWIIQRWRAWPSVSEPVSHLSCCESPAQLKGIVTQQGSSKARFDGPLESISDARSIR
jgi:hypothetical protein